MSGLKRKMSAAFGVVRELDRVALLGAATAVVPIVDSTLLLVFAPLAGNWLKENWQIGIFVYVAAAWTVCGFALLPTNVIGILCGWAFGFPLGICLHMTAIVGAALISSYALAPLVGDDLEKFFARREKAETLHKALLEKSFGRATLVVTLLRLSPAMPFALTNLLMTVARVPVSAFLIGTFVGMLPRSAAVVFFGAGLSELNFDEPFNFWTFGFGVVATAVSIIVISYLSKQALAKMTAEIA